jgi:hypothetical protein
MWHYVRIVKRRLLVPVRIFHSVTRALIRVRSLFSVSVLPHGAMPRHSAVVVLRYDQEITTYAAGRAVRLPQTVGTGMLESPRCFSRGIRVVDDAIRMSCGSCAGRDHEPSRRRRTLPADFRRTAALTTNHQRYTEGSAGTCLRELPPTEQDESEEQDEPKPFVGESQDVR